MSDQFDNDGGDCGVNTPTVIDSFEVPPASAALHADQIKAAAMLAKSGYTPSATRNRRTGVISLAAQACGVTTRTIYHWLDRKEFIEEVEKRRAWFLHQAMANLEKDLKNGHRWATEAVLQAMAPEQFDPHVRAMAYMADKAAEAEQLPGGGRKALPIPVYQFATAPDPDAGERPDGWEQFEKMARDEEP
jgi:hypothetical protein